MSGVVPGDVSRILFWGQTHFPANNMRYLHQVVIHHTGQVISGKAVRLEEHEILFRVGFLEGAVDSIAKLWPPKGITF